MSAAGGSSLILKIANHFDAIPPTAAAVERFCAERGVPAVVIGHLNLALDEVLTNTISYAWPEGDEHAAEVRLRVAAQAVEVEVWDDGVAFNPLDRPPPDIEASLDDRVPGGLGIHFVRTLMDAVSYRRESGRNVLTMRKAFVPPPPAAGAGPRG